MMNLLAEPDLFDNTMKTRIVKDDPFVARGKILVTIGARAAPCLLCCVTGAGGDAGHIYEVEQQCYCFYQSINSSINDGTWLGFPAHDSVYMDRRFWQCIGYHAETLPSHVPASWLGRIRRIDQAKAARSLKQHLESGGREPYYCIVKYIDPDDAAVPPVVILSRGEGGIWDDAGEAAHMMIGTHTVVTKLHRQATVHILRMSHEIKTPLSSLMGAFEILQHDHSASDMWKICETSIDQLDLVIQDVVRISQVNVGGLQITPKPVKFCDVLKTVLDINYGNLARRSQSTTIVAPDDMALATATYDLDEFHTRIVLNNLVSNASKYSPTGTKVTVTWDAAHVDGNSYDITVDVKDSGIGIEKSEWSRVFDELYRSAAAQDFIAATDKERNVDSHSVGMGLAICKGISRAMKGDITVHNSIVGEGTTMRFTFRAQRVVDDFENLEVHENSIHPRRSSSWDDPNSPRPLRILLVDDIAVNRIVAKRRLVRAGFTHIFEASCGHEAIDRLRKEPIDAAFIDVHMTDMEGDDVIRQVTTFPRNRIFLWSAAGDTMMLREMAEVLGVGLANKPISRDDIDVLRALVPLELD